MMDDLETSAAETEVQGEDSSSPLLLREEEDLESIRFPSYRTASKLRSLQKKSLLHHIDIWNMIEAFRENGLNEAPASCSSSSCMGERRLKELVKSLYVNLGKRLPPGPAIRDEGNVLLSWLLQLSPKTKVRCVKTALAALAAGKLMDKLRYVFSQCADGNGLLNHKRFTQFLRDLLKLPQSLGEYEAYKSSSSLEVIFPSEARITVNDFLETMMSDPGPTCLSWLLVLHRIINAEVVHHPVSCGYCGAKGFNGLRYKSDRSNYHLCQNCFWRGKIGIEHKEDVFKEYNSYKSSSGRSSFKKSLQCIGKQQQGEAHASSEGKISRSSSKGKGVIPCFPEQELPMSLGASPHPPNGGFLTPRPASRSNTGPRPPPSHPAYASLPRMDNRRDEEHSLIAEYTMRLNDEARCMPPGSRQLVMELERKNQEIIRDITKLRQNSFASASSSSYNHPHHPGAVGPLLISELHGLRSKKDDLDQRLCELQSTRRDLMTELEELMKLLKNQRMCSPAQQQAFLLQKQKLAHQAQIAASYLGGSPQDSYPPNPSSVASLSD